MEDVINMMVSDASASDISDKIKELLYAKAAERVEAARPEVAALMFGNEEQQGDEE